MAKQTEERKQVKRELTRVFQKAAQSQLDSVGVPRAKQWGLARKVVNLAEKSAATGSTADLRKTFQQRMKAELTELDKAVGTLREMALLSAITARQPDAQADITPRPQPTSITINSGPARFTY